MDYPTLTRTLCFSFWLGVFLTLSALAQEPAGNQLTLPSAIHAVPGVEMSVYFANTVLPTVGADLSFVVQCKVGNTLSNRWSLTASPAQTGAYPLTLQVTDSKSGRKEQAQTVVHVVPKEAGQRGDIAVLMVGDSLTAASMYPTEVARLLRTAGNPKLRMLGTQGPREAKGEVAHEGYGGWTWLRFSGVSRRHGI